MIELFCPLAALKEILEDRHDSKTAGHWGVQKTLDLIERDYKFPELRKTVEEYVKTCPICQAIKAERKRKLGKIQPLLIPERPWQGVHMDWVWIASVAAECRNLDAVYPEQSTAAVLPLCV